MPRGRDGQGHFAASLQDLTAGAKGTTYLNASWPEEFPYGYDWDYQVTEAEESSGYTLVITYDDNTIYCIDQDGLIRGASGHEIPKTGPGGCSGGIAVVS